MYVLVTGPPAAGKTFLAVPLARSLVLPLIGKDVIKEAMHDGLPTSEPREVWSRHLSDTAYGVMLALLKDVPAAVLDLNLPMELAVEVRRPSTTPRPDLLQMSPGRARASSVGASDISPSSSSRRRRARRCPIAGCARERACSPACSIVGGRHVRSRRRRRSGELDPPRPPGRLAAARRGKLDAYCRGRPVWR